MSDNPEQAQDQPQTDTEAGVPDGDVSTEQVSPDAPAAGNPDAQTAPVDDDDDDIEDDE